MTWNELKDFISKLDKKQLKTQVVFQDNHDNLMDIDAYILDDKTCIENEEWGTKVKPDMPYFGL